MSECLKKYETNQRIFFEMKDEILLEKYKSIWNRISNVIGKDFNGQRFCAGKYLNTKKSYNGKTFITKSNAPAKKKFFCLFGIVINFVCRIKNKDDKCYAQIYLKET